MLKRKTPTNWCLSFLLGGSFGSSDLMVMDMELDKFVLNQQKKIGERK